VIDRLRLSTVLLACGAVSLVGGSALAQGTAPSTRVSVPPAAAATGSAPSLRWTTRGAEGTTPAVEVIGADPLALPALSLPAMNRDRWTSFLAVRVVREQPAGSKDVPSLLGSYRVDGKVIRFEPRFPLDPGVRYRAEFDPVGLHAVAEAIAPQGGLAGRKPPSTTRLTAEFSLPQRRADPTARVTDVYPSRAMVPENLLRIYIHFSEPMSRGEAYRHIRLLDAAGKPVEAPFLELHEELWSNDGTRFTLLFDPGRIKRGLKPREEIGPVLEAGRSYELVIDRNWPDATGRPLKAGFRKSFRAGAPDESSPDPRTWSIRTPRPATREPLEVQFPEPLDRALLARLITVQDAAGHAVPGRVSVAGEETIWRWVPSGPWRPGAYRLTIGTDLEDVAGNSIARPFEVDLASPISDRIPSETVVLTFRIGPAPR
jgi:hypothetical protein